MIGPVLILDDILGDAMHLSALFIGQGDTPPGPVHIGGQQVFATLLLGCGARTLWRARFAVPADQPSRYRWDGAEFELAGGVAGDMRIAFASCNGEEKRDLDRTPEERNIMWARLARQHQAAPFSLLLHGGDQIYADEATKGHPLTEDWPKHIPQDPPKTAMDDLRQHLRSAFFDRYTAVYAVPEMAWLCARVPSLMQWDDHDICDGWGSLQRRRTDSQIGQTLFDVAREMALAFQHAAKDGDLPTRFADPAGLHLGWQVQAGALRILAPDLRSERGRRQIMGQGGWSMMEAARDAGFAGQTVLMSSVPLLAPRLSVLETLMVLHPRMLKYEDDLRDQWQSRAHRAEWQRILTLLCDMALPDASGTRAAGITVVSGEIHLAARATMALGAGRVLHQLTASGISHRAPPKIWARVLGALSWLGDAPLKGHPIRMRRVPGQKGLFAAERNYLILSRKDDRWRARWDLETSGMTGPVEI